MGKVNGKRFAEWDLLGHLTIDKAGRRHRNGGVVIIFDVHEDSGLSWSLEAMQEGINYLPIKKKYQS